MPRRRPPQPKYPAHQLIQLFPPDMWAHQIADACNVSRATVQRWRNPTTLLTQWQADRHAIQLGKHPSEIWANWFDC